MKMPMHQTWAWTMRRMERLEGPVLLSEKLLHAFQDGVLLRIYEACGE